MRTGRAVHLAWVASLWLLASVAAPSPLGTAFTYQGRLTDNGSPASGAYDLRFFLFDAAAGGTEVALPVTLEDVTVASGLFTVSLDFGAPAFAGEARWLEVGARPGASTGAFTVLSPRQELKPSPNAVFSQKAPWTGIIGMPAGFADGVDNDSGGTITGVTAGTGLTGGGTTGAVTLDANLAGSGTASTLARSDHNHFGQWWYGSTGDGLYVNQSAPRTALWGAHSPATGPGVGVRGTSESAGGIGVQGGAYALTGNTYGVYGFSQSGSGVGVYGLGNPGVQAQAYAGTGIAHVATGDRGIWAKGTFAGGTFSHPDNTTFWADVSTPTYKIAGTGAVSFVQNHPYEKDRVVVYAAPEGDEVAVYTRGSARLMDGVARVKLGPTFAWVANPDVGLTAHLTPRSEVSSLWVESVSTEELVVRGPAGSNAAFDYLVYGLRVGFEEVPVVQPKRREAFLPDPSAVSAEYGGHDELREFSAMERFRGMRAERGETGAVDLSRARALMTAIDALREEVLAVAGEALARERAETEERRARLSDVPKPPSLQ
jgi:hypothetical protein